MPEQLNIVTAPITSIYDNVPDKFTIIQQMKDLHKEFERHAEANRMIIFCNTTQHLKLLVELNKLLDSLPFKAKASLVPSPHVPEGSLYVTRRKFVDLEYQDEANGS